MNKLKYFKWHTWTRNNDMCTMLQCGLDLVLFDILKNSEQISDRGRFYSLCWHCILKLGRITEVTKFEKVGSWAKDVPLFI